MENRVWRHAVNFFFTFFGRMFSYHYAGNLQGVEAIAFILNANIVRR